MKMFKINHIILSMLFLVSTLVSCGEGRSTANNSSAKPQNATASTQKTPAKTTSETAHKAKKEEVKFLEFTITGGELKGKTFRAVPRYSSSDQTTYEQGQNTTLEFSRVAVEGTQLQVSFDCSWTDGLSKGVRKTVQPGGSLSIYNVGKNPAYKFERLVVNFQALAMKVTELGEWKKGVDTQKVFYAGQGSVSGSKTEAFVARFKKRPADPMTFTFKYRARAIQY